MGIKNEEEGSILVSTFLLLLFVTFLIQSVTFILYNQQHQLNQFSFSYEAKAMLRITETLIAKEQLCEEGKVTFDRGIVTVRSIDDSSAELEAILLNGYSSLQIINTKIDREGDIE